MNNALIHSKNTKLGKLQTPDPKKGENRPVFLDTLAQDDQMLKFGGADGIQKLRKRSISKFYANEIIYPLIDLKNEREKAYWNTYHCVNVLKQDENGKVTSRYCKNRWCVVCNKIRTGLLINKYLPEITEWKNPHFVTLTTGLTKTCKTAPQLTQVVKTYGNTFYKLWRRLKRNYGQIRAIRKLEITYNEANDHFHPHFHLIIDADIKICREFVKMWVSDFSEAETWSQDIRQADENSVRELFKYFTKMWKKIEGEGTDAEKRISPYAPKTMDIIFSVMQGKQVFKAYGKRLKIDDDFTPDKANVYLNENRFEETFWLWEQEQKTWINILTGELRT